MRTIAAVVMLTACSSSWSAETITINGGSPEQIVVDAGGLAVSDTSSTDVASTLDGGNAGAVRDAGAVADVVDAGASRDGSAEVVDHGQVRDAGADAGLVSDGSADAGAFRDAGARPCVDSISVPSSPYWAIRVRYVLGPNTTQSVPYYCPSTVDGNSCKYSLGGGPTAYLPPGTCRVTVPARCLPCTGTVTEW